MSSSVPSPASHPATHPGAEAFSERMLTAGLGWIETMSTHVGLQTGWYRALADAPRGLAPDELAALTSTSPRYAREWLELQAAYGIVSIADPATADAARRYVLPPDAAEVLLDGTSLAFLGPLARMFAAAGARIPELLAAYRTGGGVSWDDFGDHARQAQADLNRPWLASLPSVFAEIDDVDAALRRPGARVADVGMGAGWSSIALAQAYPGLRVEGFDVDAPSVDMARAHAVQAGVDDRVVFHLDDATHLPEYGSFDGAFAFECLHDMPHPVAVLEAMAAAVERGGPIVIMDEAVAEQAASPANEIDRLMYGFSLFICLPDGMSHPDSAATGTVMRPQILAGYAAEAGLTTEVVRGDFGLWRFYALRRSA